jgi:ribonuclease P protein component
MLNRAHRLRRRSDLTRTVRTGQRAGRGTLVVHLCRDRASALPPRAGFVVSRAVGGAVIRNAVRRRLRHLVREHLAELAPGATLVVRALPAAAGASSARLHADLRAALRAVTRPRATTGTAAEGRP